MEILRHKKLIIIFLALLLLTIVLGITIQEVRSSILVRDFNPFSQDIADLEEIVESAISEEERQHYQELLEMNYWNATQAESERPSEQIPIEDLVATRQELVAQSIQTRAVERTQMAQNTKPSGIIDFGSEGPAHFPLYIKGFYVTNRWVLYWESQRLGVFAGADEDDYEQGAVFVAPHERDDDTRYGMGKYLTPTRNGPVRIVDYEDYRLVLRAEDGTIFYFDVLGRAFIKSLDVILPTITPYPTLTPTPSSKTGPLEPYPYPGTLEPYPYPGPSK